MNIVVLGATSGIAQAIATKLAQEGHHLILAGRRMDELESMSSDLRIRNQVDVYPAHFDALAMDTHEAFVSSCLERFPTLDGVVLAYGYMGDQKESETDMDIVKRTIDTNYTSCVSILHRFATYFEQQKGGFICALSSVAGDRGRQSNYMYGSSKGALSLYLQGLRNRLSSAGVTVLTVKPGFVDTKMTYGQEGMFFVAKPEKVANDIYKAIRSRKNVLYTPFFWRWIMLIIRLIPESIFKKMKL